MQHSTLEFIQHIREETEFCMLQLANKSYDDLISDAVLSRAIIRSLEIIGEASKHKLINQQDKCDKLRYPHKFSIQF